MQLWELNSELGTDPETNVIAPEQLKTESIIIYVLHIVSPVESGKEEIHNTHKTNLNQPFYVRKSSVFWKKKIIYLKIPRLLYTTSMEWFVKSYFYFIVIGLLLLQQELEAAAMAEQKLEFPPTLGQ